MSDGEYSILGFCCVSNTQEERLGLLLFGRKDTNYSYIAETDLDLRILRFRVFNPRGLMFRSTSGPVRYRVSDCCPLCIVQPDHSVFLVSLDSLKENVGNIVGPAQSALFRCQLLKLSEAAFARSILEVQKLADELELGKIQARAFVSAQTVELQNRRAIWAALKKDRSKEGVSRGFEKWTDDRISMWLSAHCETDDSRWYDLWNYFNDFRMPNNDVIEAGLKYLEHWADDNDLVIPVGRVIQRLLKTNLDRFGNSRESLWNAIESGFCTRRFLLRVADTPWWRRVEFFRGIAEHLNGSDDPIRGSERYKAFLRSFFSRGVRVLIGNPEDLLEGPVSALDEKEVSTYLTEFEKIFDGRDDLVRLFGSEIAEIYSWSHQHLTRQEQRRWASLLRRGGWSPGHVTRTSGKSSGWENDWG